METTFSPFASGATGEGGTADGGDLSAFVLAIHHELGNHLAAIRFALQLLPAEARELGDSADRAAMQAGSLLTLLRPLLRLDELEVDVTRVDLLLESVGREVVMQGWSPPEIEIDSRLPPLRLCTEALQTALAAIALRGVPDRPALIRAEYEKGCVMIHLDADTDPALSVRERALVLHLVERLADGYGIGFTVRESAGFAVTFSCVEDS